MDIKSIKDLEKEKGVKMVYLNIRSVLKKMDQLRIYFSSSDIDVVSMSETWAKKGNDSRLFEIEGFEMKRQDRDLANTNKKRGGGLITYINSKKFPDFQILDKLSVSEPHIEVIWVKIIRKNCKNLILCNLYRPPEGSLQTAIDYLNASLNCVNKAKNDIYIMGDMNVNYLNKNSYEYKKLVFFEKSNGLNQVVTDTTRHTSEGSTLIDLIITNDRHVSKKGTLEMMVSDHQPIFVVKKKARESKENTTFTGRPYSKFDIKQFKSRLSDIDTGHHCQQTDPNKIWDDLLGYIVDDLNRNCPVRTSRFKNHRPEWINNNLIEQIRDRDYFYQKAKNTKDQDDWNIAKLLRNSTNRNIRRAKADFILDKLDLYKGDSACFWKMISRVFPGKNKAKQNKILLKLNDIEVKEENTADFINEFFINVGNTKTAYRSKKPKPKPKLHPDPFSFGRVHKNEVLRILNNINTNKSSGITHVSSAILKEAMKVFLAPLTHLYNTSMETGIFPSSWKEATVVPIPKSGDKSLVSNLRPISLLPQPGKVFEKLIHTQLATHLENKQYLSHNQHGFRMGHSTQGAVFQMLEQLDLNFDWRIPSLVTFIDFKKAFDCVQFDILLQKIEQVGFDQTVLNWIKDYLKDRQQKVVANNSTSKPLTVKQGVPQGSILGPLFYLIYANDICKLFLKCGFVFYADDTVLHSNAIKFSTARSNMQRNLNLLSKWCNKNGIYMNVDKTKYMIFGSKLTLAKIKDVTLKVNGVDLERVFQYNYLRITLDPGLNFDKHVSKLIGRVSDKINQLRRMRMFLNTEAAMLVYKNMILPILEYGDIFIMAATKENRDKLQTLQNKALRAALQVDKNYDTDLLHLDVKLPRLKVRREKHLMAFMYSKKDTKILRRSRRKKGIVTRTSAKPNYSLRKPNTEKYKKSATYKGPKIWNALPLRIQTSDNKITFKSRLKTLYKKIGPEPE